MRLYAVIKGVPEEYLEEITSRKLAQAGLSVCDSDRLSSEYSAGMKRKLSLACATIGEPKIIFLDEPSSGLDPVSRRDLWRLILNMVLGPEQTSILLTTSSMVGYG